MANISQEQLHTNFIKLSKIIHPDQNPDDPDATSKFQILVQEYEKAQKLIGPKSQYQTSIKITLKESITGCERYFVSDDNHRFVLNIPAGVKNKQVVQYRGIEINSVKNTVVHIKVLIDMPNHYTIAGNALILKIKVPYYKLIFGGTHVITSPDGNTVSITIHKNTKSGKMFKLMNFGLWNRIEKKREPLYIHIFGCII